MIGWICCLQLLLALASSAIFRSEPWETHDILLSQIEIQDSPNLEGEIPIFISLRNRVAQLNPRHCVPFSQPPMTRRAMVEVLKPASAWA
jgi:hypothetical protein